jgi:hypothetical protein
MMCLVVVNDDGVDGLHPCRSHPLLFLQLDVLAANALPSLVALMGSEDPDMQLQVSHGCCSYFFILPVNHFSGPRHATTGEARGGECCQC